MLTINLLPPVSQDLARREQWFRVVRIAASAAAGIFFLGFVFLLPSYFPIFLRHRDLSRSLALEKEAVEKLHISETVAAIRTAQRELMLLQKFIAIPPRASDSMAAVMGVRGEGIAITSLTLKGESIHLAGTAATRRFLLEFEKQLRESGRFQEVIIPLSNIVRETNISFSITAKLKPAFALP